MLIKSRLADKNLPGATIGERSSAASRWAPPRRIGPLSASTSTRSAAGFMSANLSRVRPSVISRMRLSSSIPLAFCNRLFAATRPSRRRVPPPACHGWEKQRFRAHCRPRAQNQTSFGLHAFNDGEATAAQATGARPAEGRRGGASHGAVGKHGSGGIKYENIKPCSQGRR